MNESKVGRRSFLNYAVTAIVVGVVAGVGGYYAGVSTTPPETTTTVTTTQTKTVGTGEMMTTTVTPPPVTTTVTQPPVTTTRTITQTPTTTTPKPPSRNEILVGLDVPLSGPMAFHGNENLTIIEYMVSKVNEKGGIYLQEYDKRLPVKLVPYDNKSDPTTANSNVERLITFDNVDFIMAGPGGFIHQGGLAAAVKHNVIYMAVAAGLMSIFEQYKDWKYGPFHPFTMLRDYPVAFGEWMNSLPKDIQPKRVAGWWENTADGEEYAKWYREYQAKYGYELVVDETYTQGAKDLSDLILKTKRADPDAVVNIPIPPDGMLMIKQSVEFDFNPKFWQVIRAGNAYDFAKALGKNSDAVTTVACWNWDYKTPGNKELIEFYTQKTGRTPQMAGSLVGGGATVSQILFDAIEKAGSLDSDKVRDVLVTTEFQTVAGSFRFDEMGVPTYVPVTLQWQGGDPYTVWPEEYATKPFIYPALPWKER